MKRNFFAAAILFAVCLSSCKKESVTETNALPQLSKNEQPPISPEGATNMLEAGHEWMVGSFVTTGQELSSNYRNISFQFQPSELMIATTETNAINGDWRMVGEDHLFINFEEPGLSDLNGTWPISKTTTGSIFLSFDGILLTLRLDIKQ